MVKLYYIILIITLLIASMTVCSLAQSAGPLELESINILPKNSLNITIDGRKIQPVLIFQDDIVYMRASDLLTPIGYRYEYDWNSDIVKINNRDFPAWRAGYIINKSNKELCLPVLEILSFLEMRYLYSDLYGKYILAIRTDVYDDYSYAVPVNNSPQVVLSDSAHDNSIIIYNNQNPGQYSNNNSTLPNIPGYNGSPISSVPDLMANSNYNTQVRGFGRRSLLGFYSVYGVEPQPFGTGFPNALNGPTYNYYGQYYRNWSNPWGGCNSWTISQPINTNCWEY